MEKIAEEVVKVNHIAAYFQGKLPGIADFGLKIVFSLIILLVAGKLIKWTLNLLKKPFLRAGLEEGSVHFLNSLVKAVLYILLVSGLATYLGVKEASVAALIGSIGVGIVLSLKESLSDLVGGFILLVMKPFSVGDYIKEDEHGNEGVVSKVDLFYTTLITPDNQTICIPNGALSSTSLTNLSKQEKRQLRLSVSISYEADLTKAKETLAEILDKDEKVLKEEPVEVFVDSLAASSVVLGFRAWVKPEEYWPARWRLLEQVKFEFDKNGVEIPYQKLDIAIKQQEVHSEKKR